MYDVRKAYLLSYRGSDPDGDLGIAQVSNRIGCNYEYENGPNRVILIRYHYNES
jgi:hypothetical protein